MLVKVLRSTLKYRVSPPLLRVTPSQSILNEISSVLTKCCPSGHRRLKNTEEK